jgi:hypothetical protein
MRKRSIGPGVSFFAFQDIITAVVGIFILITLTLILELNQRVESAARPTSASVDDIAKKIAVLDMEAARLQNLYETRLQQHAIASTINVFNSENKITEAIANSVAAQQQLKNILQALAAAKEQITDRQSMGNDLQQESNSLAEDRGMLAKLESSLAHLADKKKTFKEQKGLLYRNQVNRSTYVCLIRLNQKGAEIKDAATEKVRLVTDGSAFATWFRQRDTKPRHFLILIEPSGVPLFDTIRETLQESNAAYGFDLVEEGHRAALSFEWETQP